MAGSPDRSGAWRQADDDLSRRWREESIRYASAVNDFVRRGMKYGWENIERDEPQDTRQPMAPAVLDAVRRANQSGETEGLHERFPPDHGPFSERLGENGQDLPVALLLDDGRIVLRIGARYQPGRVVVIDDRTVRPMPSDIITVGRSPGREFFAIAREDEVTIRRGWNGPRAVNLPWPTGREGVPCGFAAEPIRGTPIVTRLVPFDTGDRALLVSPDGIFVLHENGAVRLLPTEEQMRDHFEWLQEKYPDDPLS